MRLPCTKEKNTKRYGEPLRLVYATGEQSNSLSPNSDELWDILGGYILTHAKLSQTLPILGVFLDFESYDAYKIKPWPGHQYPLSYDMKILNEFVKTRGLVLPDLAPAQRAVYLKTKGLAKDFSKFQIESWRQRMRSLRESIDKINPKFQIAVYPSSYTLFTNEAVWPELGTKEAPLIVCEHYTYGRGGPLKDTVKDHWRVSDETGLERNKKFLFQQKTNYAARKAQYHLLGGIDPLVLGGEDPQFQAFSAEAMSQVAEGYWVSMKGRKPVRPGLVCHTRHARSRCGFVWLTNPFRPASTTLVSIVFPRPTRIPNSRTA